MSGDTTSSDAMSGDAIERGDAGAALAIDEAADAPRWVAVCALEDVPRLGARVIERPAGADVAVFRGEGDRVFALLDRCPHKGGPLSQGIVFGERVACPLHGWTIGLADGQAVAPDHGCARRFAVRVDGGRVWLDARELAREAP